MKSLMDGFSQVIDPKFLSSFSAAELKNLVEGSTDAFNNFV